MKAYPKYKDSGVEWLGQIPEKWIINKFCRSAFYQEGPGLRNWQFKDNGIKVICVSNITENGIDFSTYQKYISFEEYQNLYKHFTVKRGDLILSSSGNSWGKVSEYKSDEVVILNTSTIRINQNQQGKLLQIFIKWILQSDSAREQLGLMMTGSCQPNFGPTHLAKVLITFPPFFEQQTIATYLDRKTQQIDRLIEIKQKQVELFKEQRSAIINQAVTKGIVRIMFDSNAFDKLLENDVDLDSFPYICEYYSTHIQHDEISNITDPAKIEKRDKLLSLFKDIEQVDSDVFVWASTQLGGGRLCSDEDAELFEKLKGGNERYTDDAIIGTTVIKQNMILVSDDERLRKKVNQNGGKAVTFDEFKDGSFYKMKDSGIEWLGEIPEGWDVKRLKHIALIKLSNVDKKSIEGQEQVKLCNYIDVYYRDYIANDINFMKATATASQINDFTLNEGDVLITKDSESPDDIAVAAYATSDVKGVICGYHLAHIRPRQTQLNGNYLFRSFQARTFLSQFEMSANGITRYGISKATINDSIFIMPILHKQQYIASYLDRKTKQIDSIIKSIQTQIDQLKEYRTSLISSVVTGKIDVRDEV